MTKKQTVFVAVYEHKYGDDINVFTTWKAAQAWKDEIGAEYWKDISDDPQPEDPCGDEYFELQDKVGDEWFHIKECEVEDEQLEMKNEVAILNGWKVEASECGQYLYIQMDGSPGQIHIKAEDEGFVVDIWRDDPMDCVATTCATYAELESE